MHRVLTPFVMAATLAVPALATDRFYRDSTATSPSGRYRIDAKSPDNAGPYPRPFASNFAYTLTDTTTNKVVWARKQPMHREKGSGYASSDEASPTSVYVTDTGLVVASLSGHSVIVLDAADGHKRGEAAILSAFPKTEQDNYVSMSTAGPMWQQRSDWFFAETPADGKSPAATLFVVRPYWGHRIVVNCADATLIDLGAHHSAISPSELKDASPIIKRQLSAILELESARAIATIKSGKQAFKSPEDYRARWDLATALHTAAFRKLTEAEPDIRTLESWLATQQETGSIQQQIRQALRAMGKTPLPGCGVQLYAYNKVQYGYTPDQTRPYLSAVPPDTRVQNAPNIAKGMTIQQVCDLIGCPDAELYENGTTYDWDIDATPPYTLRVTTVDIENVGAVRTITPLAFLHDPARMRGR